MLNLRSSASASTPSRALRPKVRLLVKKMLRASCWVMVDPPCFQRPLSTRTLTDRAMPIGSTPKWLRKRLSSTEIIAARIVAGILS